MLKLKKTKQGYQVVPVCPECGGKMTEYTGMSHEDPDHDGENSYQGKIVLDSHELSCDECGLDIDLLTS